MPVTRTKPRIPSLTRRFLVTLAVCAILALAARSIIGDRGLFEMWRQKSTYRRLTTEVQALRKENISLNREIRALRSQPLAIERIAREELGYARPGEITFILREDEGSGSALDR